MFGIDDRLVQISNGGTIWIVVVVAALLGLRHATDPDHLVAITTLVAGGAERTARTAGALGAAWGLGHMLTLFAFGLPVLVLAAYLPERLQQVAETGVGFMIVYLAARLLLRWRRGFFHTQEHQHGSVMHSHLHAHARTPGSAHALGSGGERSEHSHSHVRTSRGAFGIGLVHGAGGSAGVGVLLVASIESTALAIASLVVLAACTAVSMWMLSMAFGLTLDTRRVRRGFNGFAPALGLLSLAFGTWYVAAAWKILPYPF